MSERTLSPAQDAAARYYIEAAMAQALQACRAPTEEASQEAWSNCQQLLLRANKASQ